MNETGEHWDEVYATRAPDEVSWFQRTPATSLRLLNQWASPRSSVIDLGGGASTLVDSLLDAGWEDLTVLDISSEALKQVRGRLTDKAQRVHFVVADARSWQPRRTYDVWHDRAVFHFLVDATDRDRYIAVLSQALAPGGVVVMGTFAHDGPTQCSGLATARYDREGIARIFAPAFTLEHTEREEHVTPSGTFQPFLWSVLRRATGE